MKRSLAWAPALLLLGAAMTMTPGVSMAAKTTYKAAGPKGGTGWSTHALANGRYAVVYTGSSKDKKDEVAKFAFLRAAEFTQESNFQWFAVISSQVRNVEQGSADDLAGRTGEFMGGTKAGMGSGTDLNGNDPSVNLGPSTGGFGGGDAPPGMMERWQPKKVPQAVLIIQMGNGDQAKFDGVTKQPEIFDAKATIAELTAPDDKDGK
jgi:hypothetical protein